MVSSTITNLFDEKDNRTITEATVRVKVEMNPSDLASKLSDEIAADITRIGHLTGMTSLAVQSEDILKYLKTLTWLRVSRVNHDRSEALRQYTNLSRHCAIPVMFYQCLIPMGLAYDRDYAIEFSPVYSIDSTDLLSPDDMQLISDVMTRVEPNGFKVVYGIPMADEGELDFMALSHVTDLVLSYKKGHPVYGFLAAFFKQHQLSEITGMMSRIIYGYESDYRTRVAMIYRSMTK